MVWIQHLSFCFCVDVTSTSAQYFLSHSVYMDHTWGKICGTRAGNLDDHIQEMHPIHRTSALFTEVVFKITCVACQGNLEPRSLYCLLFKTPYLPKHSKLVFECHTFIVHTISPLKHFKIVFLIFKVRVEINA